MLTTDQNNGDAQLSVRFYDGTIRSEFKSAQEGRDVVEDAVYVEINVPGNATLQVIDIAHEGHKARFPLQWQHYLNKRGDATMGGTPLDELTFLSPAARENLKALKFYSVEQVANAADADLMRFGMSLGMQPLTVRDKAVRYLQFSDKNSGFTQLEQKLAQAETEKAAMQGMLQEMAERLSALESKRGPGRPPKEAEAA